MLIKTHRNPKLFLFFNLRDQAQIIVYSISDLHIFGSIPNKFRSSVSGIEPKFSSEHSFICIFLGSIPKSFSISGSGLELNVFSRQASICKFLGLIPNSSCTSISVTRLNILNCHSPICIFLGSSPDSLIASINGIEPNFESSLICRFWDLSRNSSPVYLFLGPGLFIFGISPTHSLCVYKWDRA